MYPWGEDETWPLTPEVSKSVWGYSSSKGPRPGAETPSKGIKRDRFGGSETEYEDQRLVAPLQPAASYG